MRARSARSHHSMGRFSLQRVQRARRSAAEPATEHDTFRFECQESGIGILRGDAKRLCQGLGGRRADKAQTAAHELGDRGLSVPGAGSRRWRIDSRLERDVGMNGEQLGQALRSDDDRRRTDRAAAGAPDCRQNVDERAAGGVHFAVAEHTDGHQRVVELVGAAWFRPFLVAHAVDCRLVERSEITAGRIRTPPRLDGVAPPLFERRVVEERVGLRAENLVREGRRLWCIPGDQLHLAGMDPCEDGIEAVEIHGLFEAVANGLRDERVIGNLPIAGDVLEAGGRVGEDRRQ